MMNLPRKQLFRDPPKSEALIKKEAVDKPGAVKPNTQDQIDPMQHVIDNTAAMWLLKK